MLKAAGDFSLPAEDDEIAAGRENFSAVVIAVEALEWLFLAHSGHRRARFEGMSAWGGVWLTP